MTLGVVEWLLWLVGQQTIQIGAPDSRAQADMAWQALGELEAAREAAMTHVDNL